MSDLSPIPSPLAQAILDNKVPAVAKLLDAQAPIGEPELLALVKLAFAHRATPEDDAQLVAIENARQIYTLMVEGGGDIRHLTNRGRIVDRIHAIQPDWPSAEDLDDGQTQVHRIEALTADEAAAAQQDQPQVRAARGAMHRRPR